MILRKFVENWYGAVPYEPGLAPINWKWKVLLLFAKAL